MIVAGVSQQTSRARRQFKHSIAQWNRPIAQGNAFLLEVASQGRLHGTLEIFLGGGQHVAALKVDGEEDPGVEVDEEEADPEAVESERHDKLGSE